MTERESKPTVEDDFIAEANGSVAGTLFEARYRGDPASRVIARTERFAVLADLAPLCPGHVLIVPRDYFPSFGALPPAWWPEFERLLARIGRALEETFGPPSMVEHGSSSRPRHSPCVIHAHLHLLPAPADLGADLRSRGFVPRSIDSLRELAALAARDRAYVCWGSAGGPIEVADVESGEGIPRQYLRRVLAQELGDGAWDWGVPPPPEPLRATVRDLRACLDGDRSSRVPSS